jgi:hypothetical protein
MSAGTERGTYLTVDELEEIKRIIQSLQTLGENYLTCVSIGSIPLSDSNGDPLGVIGYGDDGYVYYPAGANE